MKLSIRKFQELYFIARSEDNDIDKPVKMVSIVTDLNLNDVKKMNEKKFNLLCQKIQSKFEILHKKIMYSKRPNKIKVNGRTYKISYNIEDKSMNAGKYVEAITFGKDVIDNLHKLLATMATPVRFNWRKMKYVAYERDHIDIATDMEDVDFEMAYHSVVFFYLVCGVSIKNSLPYLMKEMKMKGMTEDMTHLLLEDLMSILDGLPMPKWSLISSQYLLNRFGS